MSQKSLRALLRKRLRKLARRAGNTKLMWRIWGAACRLPNVCPANAHGVLIWQTQADPRINWVCREDCARNRTCWCGKLREPGWDKPEAVA
jgi:hypothetical protein